MIDALGDPGHLLLLGGTSDIALATAKVYAARRPGGSLTVTLAARPGPRRTAAAEELLALGVTVIERDFDAEDTGGHVDLVRAAAESADIDVALIAFGLLGSGESWQDHDEAVQLAQVNFTGAVSVGVALAEVMKSQGHGSIVALSSVAGERVRRSNFVYGSTKAGMDGFYLGLGEALQGTGVSVSVIRPGFVKTKMTDGLEAAPLSVTAHEVAEAIVAAVAKRSELVWVPAPLRVVMSGLRHVPRPLFRRLPL